MVRPTKHLPIEQILAWADAWHTWYGNWPTATSGPIPGTLGETWARVDMALRRGGRGLPGGSSLLRLLAEARGVSVRRVRPATVARWHRVLVLRAQGWTFAAIGRQLGISKQAAQQLCHRAARAGRADAEK